MNNTTMLKSQENFFQILDALADMVLVKGPEAKLVWANRAFCAHYNMTPEQLKGIIDAPFNKADLTEQYVIDDNYVFRTGNTLDIPEEIVTRHDGVPRLFHTVKSAIRDEAGKVILTVGISRDITDRKEIEENLKVERARSMYSSKMATLGEMAGGIAHEINTPLTVIKLLAGQSLDIFADQTPDLERIKTNFGKIEKTVDRIARIISGLRAFSREGKNDPSTKTAIAGIVDETLAFSKEKILSHEIDLSVTHADPEAEIDCRTTEISQVLLNLLNNAHDAIVDNVESKWIRIESKIIGTEAEISVTDSGLGISEKALDQIFQPFYTTKEIGKGTGLGLSISKGILEAHGGTLACDSACPNTRFVMRLPLKSYTRPKNKSAR